MDAEKIAEKLIEATEQVRIDAEIKQQVSDIAAVLAQMPQKPRILFPMLLTSKQRWDVLKESGQTFAMFYPWNVLLLVIAFVGIGMYAMHAPWYALTIVWILGSIVADKVVRWGIPCLVQFFEALIGIDFYSDRVYQFFRPISR